MKTTITFLTGIIIMLMVSINITSAQTMEDVVYLKNGSIIHGTIIEQVPNVQIKIQTKDGNVFVYKLDEIEKMTKEKVNVTQNDNEEETILNLKPKKLGNVGFRKGRSNLGLLVGYAWSGLAFGAGYEYAFSDMLGGGIDASYVSFSQDLGYGGYKYDYTLIGGLVSFSFHFSPGKSFDPFIKAGIGYFNWDAKYSGPSGSTSLTAGYSSGIGYGGQAGFNYYFSKSIGVRMVFGYPFYASAGLSFTF